MGVGAGTDLNDIVSLRGVGVGMDGYGGGRDSFAGPGSNAVRTIAADRNTTHQAQCTREVLGAGIDSINNSFETSQRNGQFATAQAERFQGELRVSSQISSLQREMNENARRDADRACDTQKELIRLDAKTSASNAAILAKIEANQELNKALAELAALKTQVACGCTTGCTRRCGGD